MKTRKKILILTATVIVLLIIAVGFYSCVTESALKEEVACTDRDPDTGIVRGAEPVTLNGGGQKACLLVHGWAGSRIDFNDLGERLKEKGITCRLMLLPGHGTTPEEFKEVGVDDYLEAVRSEMDRLRKTHEEVSLIGFSMGGSLSVLEAARSLPDRLVLAAPYFEVTYRLYYVLPPEVWNSLLSPFIEYVEKDESFIRVNREEAKEKIFSYQVIPTQAVTVLCEVGERAQDPEVLGRVTCPVLLLHSSGDMAASCDEALEAFDLLGSRKKVLHIFEQSNHHLFWDFDREEVMKRIVDFLSED